MVVVLDDDDMKILENGEMIHVKLSDGRTVGLVTEKWVDDMEEEKKNGKRS